MNRQLSEFIIELKQQQELHLRQRDQLLATQRIQLRNLLNQQEVERSSLIKHHQPRRYIQEHKEPEQQSTPDKQS